MSEICGTTPEGDDAFLDAGATGVVDADDRAPCLHGEVHDLADLLAEDLAETSAENGEVLAEHAHRPAVDGAVSGDDAVAVGALVLDAEVVRAVTGKCIELDERAGVEQRLHPLARGHAALGVPLVDRGGGAGVLGLVDLVPELRELARGRVQVGHVGRAGLGAHSP